MYRVMLLNDHYTTMEFVIHILEQAFNKTRAEAEAVMLTVHTKGSGVAGVFTKEIAETKIAVVEHLARQNNFPLKCAMDPE